MWLLHLGSKRRGRNVFLRLRTANILCVNGLAVECRARSSLRMARNLRGSGTGQRCALPATPRALEPVLALQLMTVGDRVSGVRSGGLLQQISSIGARRTLRDAALQWNLAVAAAGRVVGCAGRAEFASPAHILGAAAVVAATDGRLGARLVLHGGRPMRPPATAGRLQPQTRG